MTAEREACGLGSIIPMSCRGRAEAFARRLQSRLQSLGGHGLGSGSGLDDSSDETSWIGRDSGITNCQPRHSSSTESDIYFDFDYESPGSPEEEVAEVDLAEILVNKNVEQSNKLPAIQERDSGSLSLSAGDGNSEDSDSSDGPYFDTVGSHTEDGRVSRENSLRSKKSHSHKRNYNSSTHNGKVYSTCNGFAGHHIKHHFYTAAEVETPDHYQRNKTEQFEDVPQENGLNIHENHYDQKSTKDAETDEDKISCGGSSFAQMSEDSSDMTSDYTTAVDVESVDTTSCNSIVILPREESTDTSSVVLENGDVVQENGDVADYLERHCSDDNTKHEISPSLSSIQSENIDDDCKKSNLSLEQNFSESLDVHTDDDEDKETGQNFCISLEKPSEFVVECSPLFENRHSQSESEVQVLPQVKNEAERSPLFEDFKGRRSTTDNDTQVKNDNEQKAKMTITDDDNEDDEEYERPQRLQRSSSLKTGKTPPGTPGRKKIVRFADVLGLDLADVRTFLDEIPKVPSSAYDDLRDVDLSLGSDASPVNGTYSTSNPIPIIPSVPKPAKCLTPLFQQPGGQADFMDRIRDGNVCLENAVISDSVTFTITGTVRVRNLDFHKSVHIRYSIDNWNTFADHQATYIQNSCDGFSDKFSFVLYAHTLAVGQRLEFAVRFQCRGAQYWDNNRGANYAFQCLPPTSTSIPSLTMASPVDETWTSFY